MKTGFITTDYVEINSNYYLIKAIKSGLTILDYKECSHLKIAGFKQSFIKYYISTAIRSIKDGQTIKNEITRLISVLTWR